MSTKRATPKEYRFIFQDKYIWLVLKDGTLWCVSDGKPEWYQIDMIVHNDLWLDGWIDYIFDCELLEQY